MRFVRHHLLAAAIVLLSAQGMGVAAMAQVGLGGGEKTSCSCKCGCCRNSPGRLCPMCARMQQGSDKCDCAARATREAALPWWLDVVALLPAPAPAPQIAFVGDVASSSFSPSDVFRCPPSPPPRGSTTGI